jgi:hypothetical protein
MDKDKIAPHAMAVARLSEPQIIPPNTYQKLVFDRVEQEPIEGMTLFDVERQRYNAHKPGYLIFVGAIQWATVIKHGAVSGLLLRKNGIDLASINYSVLYYLPYHFEFRDRAVFVGDYYELFIIHEWTSELWKISPDETMLSIYHVDIPLDSRESE